MLLTERYQPSGRTFDPATVVAAMGCVSSKAEHDAGFANVNLFQVMNVDDSGRRLCPGQLEVSDSDLILYQRGKSPMRWPLRSLRRYGFDADLFSFECGRRCPTGPGIYAFQCRRAELLFNNVQARVAARHEEQELTMGASQPRSRIRHSTLLSPASLLQNGVGVGVDELDDEGSYLEPIRLQGAQVWSLNSRPLSASSLISSGSSPMSPSANLSASVLYVNNDAAAAAAAAAAATAAATAAAAAAAATAGASAPLNDDLTVVGGDPVLPPPVAYANVEQAGAAHLYGAKLDDLLRDDDDQQHHLYINVGPEATEVKSRLVEPGYSASAPLKQVNYVLLDLDKGSDSTTSASLGTAAHPLSPQGSLASFPESPHRTVPQTAASASASSGASVSGTGGGGGGGAVGGVGCGGVTMSTQTPLMLATADGYATIDFDRTAALSNTASAASAGLTGADDEGLRKTRHNATATGTSATTTAAAAAAAAAATASARSVLALNRQTSSIASD